MLDGQSFVELGVTTWKAGGQEGYGLLSSNSGPLWDIVPSRFGHLSFPGESN